MKKRVVVGLSGGVDSSVAAYLLKEEGYEVIGLFMKNWHDTSVTISKECPWLDDSNDAMIVAEKLGIPFQVLDLSEPYRQKVVDYMFNEYEKGRTPNPDVLCNREIKFDVFLKAALELGADYVATGHYARKESFEKNGTTIYRLLAGSDPNKDQSYFLCQLSQEQLSKALFPIGDLLKPRVREIARQQGLITADKKDSQGLCFVGKVHLPDFLKQKLTPKEGDIIKIPADWPEYADYLSRKNFADKHAELIHLSTEFKYTPSIGTIVGRHNGAHFFTIGQRKGLNVGGSAEPLFVIGIDVKNNLIYVGMGKNHPGLWRKGLFIASEDEHWVREDLQLKPDQAMRVEARIRYRQPLVEATLYKYPEGLYMEFDRAVSAITEGQFAAWYSGQELIGSGVIDHCKSDYL